MDTAEQECGRAGAEDRGGQFWTTVVDGAATAAVAGLSVVTVALCYKVSNFLEDVWNLAEEDDDKIELRALLSMLVHAIYSRDLGRWERGVVWLADYNNKRADGYMWQHWESYPCSDIVSESELKDLGLAFLLCKRSHRNPNAPGLAIVLRGTIVSRMSDIKADLRIAVQRLNGSNRVLRTLTLVLKVVEEYRKENPAKRICMTGHSLGAAIALIVGGILYSTYNIDIDTHLFNPPLLTVADVLTGRAFPAGADHDPELMESTLKAVCTLTLSGNREAISSEWAQFQKLQSWTPHFYLNSGDLICHRYIEFFKTPVVTPDDVTSSQGLLSTSVFKRDARCFENVVPSAHVYISTWKKENLLCSEHTILQWFKFQSKHIDLKYHQYKSNISSRNVI